MATDTAVTVRESGAVVEGGIDWKVMEEVLTKGNLSKLTPQQRMTYYKQACESIGWNPLTRPMEYIEFWAGKDKGMVGQLYVTRNGTDQLRKMHKVNVEILSQRVEGGILTVHVRATMGNRTEEEIGSLFIGGMSGQDLANAHMKAMTKAKRRVTLAICGLSFLDETEAETLPRAQFLTEEEMSQRAAAQAPRLLATAAPPPPPAPSNVHQHSQLRALASHGFPLADHLSALGYESIEDLTLEQARDLITEARVAVRTAPPAVPIVPEDIQPTPAEIPIEEPPVPAGLQKQDLRRLWTVASNSGYSTAEVHALINEFYPAAVGEDGFPSSRMLTPLGVQHLINHMESNPLGVEDGEIVGTKALQEFWAHARGVGWRSQEVQDAATRVWPALRTPMGTMDPTKLRTGQLTQLFRMVDGHVTLARDADGNAFFEEVAASQG